ncbi:MAG: phosphotransferase family protein [Candidatus Thorarchaeota archaeon]|jgi:aminoglycoside phosphotransferase (APT) family kinase protein
MDESSIQRYFRFKHPGHEPQIRNIRNITSGWETEIFAFDLDIDDDAPQKLVVRVFPGDRAETKAKKEFKMMKGVQELGYSVPLVHHVETESSHLGRPFIIMDRIEGGTLNDRLPENQDRWTKVLLRLFVDLHKLDWREMVEVSDISKFDDPLFYIKTTLSRYEEILEKHQKQELLPIVNWMRKRITDVPCESPSITHGDFHPMNVLIDSKERAYVIDWGASGIADFRSDLAWTLTLVNAYDTLELRNRILEEYELALGGPVHNIEYFEVLGCLRRLFDVTSSFDKGADEIGLRPEAVEMMKQTIGHVVRVRDRLKDLTEISIPEINDFIENLTE